MHAIIAVLMGISWIYSEWNSNAEERIFAFNRAYFVNSSVGFAYFVFDVGIVILNADNYSMLFLISITVHHMVFLVSFFVVLYFPAVLAYKLYAVF